MASDYLESELIDSFLNGNLKGDELVDFENRMSSDSNFASQVDNQKSFNQSVEDHELAKFHSKLDKFNPYKNAQNFTLFPWKRLALAVAVLSGLAIGSITLLNSDSDEESPDIEPFLTKQDGDSEPVSNISNKTQVNSEYDLNQGKPQDEENKKEDNNLSMYDYLDGNKPSKKDDNLKAKESISMLESSEPSYVVVGKEIQEENVLVISSDYNKTMKYDKDHKCSNLSLNAKIEVVSNCEAKSGVIKVIGPKIYGGKAPFLYGLNSGEFQKSLVFDNLSKGEYLIKVRDAEGCIIECHNQITVKLLDCE